MLMPATPEAYQLLHEGAIAMAAISRIGLKIDVPYLDKAIIDTKKEIASMREAMREDEVFSVWQKHFGTVMNLTSYAQLGKVVFDVLGHKRNPLLGTSNSESALKHVKLPFVKNWVGVQKLEKALGTFLYGIRREVIDGVIHPFFDLYTAESYRSSSSKINFQNQPVRNKKVA